MAHSNEITIEDQVVLELNPLTSSSHVHEEKDEEMAKEINDAIEKKDIDQIKKLVTPKGLSQGQQNILERSLEVSYDIKKAGDVIDNDDLKTLGLKVEDFACQLLKYSKKAARGLFKEKDSYRDCIAEITDTALRCKAKKFLAGTLIQECQGRLWYKMHHKYFSSRRWKWTSFFFTLVEFFLFPLIFLGLFLWHKISRICGIRGLDYQNPMSDLPEDVRSKYQEDQKQQIQESNIMTIGDLRQYYEDIKYHDGVTKIDRCIKDKYERYKEHFETPYFIFVRDILSLLMLLVLHILVCAYPTVPQLNSIEHAIMIFFVGRILQVIDQCKQLQPSCKTSACCSVANNKNYYHDLWSSLMEYIPVVVFFIIYILRVVTSNNVVLMVASYMYGINGMLLTWRVFDTAMELRKSTGTKQIALRKILEGVTIIFVQLLGALVAFSTMFTAIYVAEIQYDAQRNVTLKGVCLMEDGFSCAFRFFEYLSWTIVGTADSQLLTLKSEFSKYFTKVLYLLFIVVAVVIIVNMLIALLSNTYQKVEDNAFHVWSYKRAYTIKLYRKTHPVTVPLNIISIPIKWLYRCSKNKCKCRNPSLDRQEKGNETKSTNINGNLGEFSTRLKNMYFAEHGNTFLLDRQVNEFENNQLLKQIAYEVFRENFTMTRSDEWEYSDGIKKNGRQLLFLKCKNCKTQNNGCIHGARHKFSLSKDCPEFEVLIQNGGEKRQLGIGVASKNYPLNQHPGIEDHSVGYRIDTGKTYDTFDQMHNASTMSFGGDLVRCSVLFNQMTGNNGVEYLPVQFTCNGEIVGEAKLEASLAGNIHPFISMACSGIKVIFRRTINAKQINSTRELQDMKAAIGKLQQNVKRILRHLEASNNMNGYHDDDNEGNHGDTHDGNHGNNDDNNNGSHDDSYDGSHGNNDDNNNGSHDDSYDGNHGNNDDNNNGSHDESYDGSYGNNDDYENQPQAAVGE